MDANPCPDIPQTSEELIQRLTNSDLEHVDFSIDYLRSLFRNGLDINTEVERKAALLVGSGGITAAILVALAGFSLNFPSMLPSWSRFVLLGFFVVLAITFFMTILYSMKALLAGKISYPGALLLLEGQHLDTIEYKKRHAADLFIAYRNNNFAINGNLNALAAAQKWFRASVGFLLLAGGFIVIIALLPD